MILIPEQISQLHEQVSSAKINVAGYKDYLQDKDITSGDYSARAFIGDSVLDNQYFMECQNYYDAMYYLEMADYKQDRHTDIIGIGTKFSIRFDGETEEDDLTLIEGIDGVSSRDGYVSLNSLLGQNVIGKPEGSSFEYDVVTGPMPWDKRHISGVITSIQKDPKAYPNFIRAKDKRERIGKKYKNRRHELLIADTEEAITELESYQAISSSQRLLLLIEASRLSRRANDRSAINRMTVVKKLLKDSPVIEATDGTIGVGTKFEIKINRDGVIETKKAEMINQAVSDEIESDYVERISPLGYQLYGLRVGAPFTYREGNKTYKGCVAAISQPQPKTEELGYQYRK